MNKGFQVLDQYWCRHTSPHEVSGAQCLSRRLILAVFELVFVFSLGGPTPSEAAGGRPLTQRSKTLGPGHSLSTHTIREHSRAREEEGGSREIAHDSDDGVEQAARSCEPTATRAFGVTAIWMDRTFCYACCPPLLTLKDNLHSRCAAISDYPSRPSPRCSC